MENDSGIQVRFADAADNNASGKLASAEIHFTSGGLAGLRLLGFTVWSQKSGGRNVTFPARQYVQNGQRRSFDLLRPLQDDGSKRRLQDLILAAYDAHGGGGNASAPQNAEFPDLPRP